MSCAAARADELADYLQALLSSNHVFTADDAGWIKVACHKVCVTQSPSFSSFAR
jgi:hypothetical protein